MMAIIGMRLDAARVKEPYFRQLTDSFPLRFFQDGLTGSAWGDWANYTDSPLRSGVKSPGFNTLPEWEKPKTGRGPQQGLHQ